MTTLFALPAFAGLLLVGAPAAEAQCSPDSALCAEVHVGSTFNARAQIRVGTRTRVVVREAPPPPARSAQVIVVQPAQPPPPPPPPAQPPVVIVQPVQPVAPPATATVIVTTTTRPQTQVVQVQQQQPAHRERRQPSFGMHLQLAGILGPEVSMFGFRVGPRFRPGNGHFALEFNVGYFSGSDYNNLERTEIPFSLNTFFFVNPQHRFQFYGVLGLGLSYGFADGVNRFSGEWESTDFAHFNGEAGVGVEWRIKRWFALNIDVRALIRSRVSDDFRPEFTEYEFGSPTGRTTNTSGGAIINGGAVFYW